jgi:hypothetical protein
MTVRPRYLFVSVLSLALSACGGGERQSTIIDGEDAGDVDHDGAPSSHLDGGTDAKQTGSDSGGGNVDLAMPDPDAEVNLTFTGCSPQMTDLRVVTNVVAYDSLDVVNAMYPLSGDVQTALKDPTPRTVQISSTQRSQSMNGVVINVNAGGVIYTNMCHTGTLGCTYNAGTMSWVNDPVSGTFKINQYDPHAGKLDVEFTNVVLQDIQGSATCKVNGTLKTKRLSTWGAQP